MRKITASDVLNWRIEEQKEENKTASLIGYRKYLDEALIKAGEDKNSINLYYEMMKHFKTLVEPHIETSKKREYTLKYDNNNMWNSRNKNVIMQSLYEFTLKRICLSDEVDYMESLKRVHAMSVDEIFKKVE
jgi:hypothetical protein